MRRRVSLVCLALLSYAVLTRAEPLPADLASCTEDGAVSCVAPPSCAPHDGVDFIDKGSLQLNRVGSVALPCPAIIKLEYFEDAGRSLCRVSLALADRVSKVHFAITKHHLKTQVIVAHGKVTVEPQNVMIGPEKEAFCDGNANSFEKRPEKRAGYVIAVVVLHCTERTITPTVKPEIETTDEAAPATPATAPTHMTARPTDVETTTAAHPHHDDDEDYEHHEDPTTTHHPHPPDDHTGLIIGIVLGVIFIVAAFVILYNYRKYHKRLPPADFAAGTPTYSTGSTPPTPSLRSEKSIKDKNMLKKVAFMLSRESRKKQLIKKLQKEQEKIERSKKEAATPKKNDENTNKDVDNSDKSDKNVDSSCKTVDSSVKKIAKIPTKSVMSPAKNPKSPGSNRAMFKV